MGVQIDDIVSRWEITEGWSGDRKYCACSKDGNRYFLRISPEEKYDRRKRCFEMMRRAAALGIPMCAPLAFGRCDEGVYILQDWIDGESAETYAARLDGHGQYLLGAEAGRILGVIHSIPAPKDAEAWETVYGKKLERNLKIFETCHVRAEGAELFAEFVRENRDLIIVRPQCFQHGDYHIGNMMAGADGQLYIIDFDRDDVGDPWEEFNRIVWCAPRFPDFASGMIDGYFGGSIPDKFWQLMKLYIAVNQLSSVAWAIPLGREQTEVMINQAKNVLKWYGNMRLERPLWYSPRR